MRLSVAFICTLALAVFAAPLCVSADLPLVSNVLGSNMVLQAAPSRARLWGWTPNASQPVKVVVSPGVMYAPVSSAHAPYFWAVDLDATPASYDPVTITISSGGKNVVLENVLFGEVFFCGGQSNMEMAVNAAFNATQEIAAAGNYPNIRLFTVGQQTISMEPLLTLATIEQPWSVASPQSVGGKGPWDYFSATCWYFGRNMYENLKVPIGLVSSNWGGTIVQAWSSPDALAECPCVNPTLPVPKAGPNPNQNSVLWNAMVVPFLNMRMRLAIWYQGESNVGPKSSPAYACQFPAMIKDWGRKFNTRDFSFFFVQLAPYFTDVKDLTSLPLMRLVQELTLAVPRVGMASAVDLGDADPNNPVGAIHPRDKANVGLRLSKAALNMVYGRSVAWRGPYASYSQLQPQNSTVRVYFEVQSQYGESLVLKPAPACPKDPYCAGFEVQDATTKNWVPLSSAPKMAVGNSIDIAYPSNVKPVAIRYLFADWPLCSVFSSSGLPAVPFNVNILQ